MNKQAKSIISQQFFQFNIKLHKIYHMSQANPQQDLVAIFNQIDKDQDGVISRADLQQSGYAASIFQSNQNALMAFNVLHNKMNQKEFALLANGYKYKLHDLAITKFQILKSLGKYLTVSSQGEAGPSIKQSYMKLYAHNEQFLKSKGHSIGIEFGIDKPKQQFKIKQVAQALGHNPHEVFLLFKLKTKSNGEQIAAKLQALLNNVVQLVKEMAAEFQQHINCLKIYSKYYSGYVYLVIQVENPFLDNIISFFNEVIQAISPEFCLKFKANLTSNIKHILKESFQFEKSGGEIDIEFDIDTVTLKKIKEIIGDNIDENSQTQDSQVMALLLQEIKLSAKFENLAQALTTALNIPAQSFPKPSNFLGAIKELNLKQTIGQFFEDGPQFIDLVKNNCQFEGELSLNLEDIFLKISFDLQIQEAFDLL